MKKFVSILTIFIILISCEKKETPLVFDTKTYNPENLNACEEGICPVIKIEKLTASGNGGFSDTINNAVEQVLVNTLSISPEDIPNIKTLDEALDNFITSYRAYRNDFPEASVEYNINSTSQISYESEKVLSIIFDNYSYWGGAHGYGSTTYINFDKETHEQLSKEALFSDQAGFLKFAETQFRNQKGIAEDENINSRGYFFENDSFSLPENIGFKDDKLILIYNPYEIASYADGQIILEFPITEVQKYLRPNL
ncbi:DUF3298 and DUF4163 domain-containing protein [Leeuwenhoekiella marinoflava]|uniref:Deacetylase PdaC domain-containing protein n=2 Tax=Leeuwenhoekiella marinoflava TaxID=988 RepID=A0A4Q0PRA7_9FLAO|nr:DUF3298 and DUF4163 domain-containing protein [Leeuwenhoekiella marinoflava]RXG33136.1 putative protein DUF3298 [Leeuwenhoekiella marinoflava]SHE39687.1 Protein of unknown function [Leeuwenhoekiella marinoflava DSM 3653]